MLAADAIAGGVENNKNRYDKISEEENTKDDTAGERSHVALLDKLGYTERELFSTPIMAQFCIIGQQPLSGSITVSGAKNHALKVIAASILSKEDMVITRVPVIEDVKRLLEILEHMGAEVSWDTEKDTLRINTAGIKNGNLPPHLVKRIRASAVLIGPLLARFGKVEIAYPGGCVLGRRPIDLFIDGFRAMGAKVTEGAKTIRFVAKKLQGSTFFMPQISVTVTETLMMASTLAGGTTILENAACEPEIPALAAYLNKQGAKISGAGTHTIVIRGVPKLRAGECAVMPDRIEAGTFAILAAASRSNITIEKCDPAHLRALFALFDGMGIPYTLGKDWIHVDARGKKKFASVNIKTHEYPGVATDLQAPLTVLLTQCEGVGLVHETIFESRLFYLDKLNQMGAHSTLCDPHRALVQGPTVLSGRHLESPDIRAGMALVIAGLIARGETRIDNIYQIERGYARVTERLQKLGAHIQVVES